MEDECRAEVDIQGEPRLVRDVAVSFRSCYDVAFPEIPLEEFDRHSIDHPGGGCIIARALVTHKSVSTVELVPAEDPIRIGQRVVDNRFSARRDDVPQVQHERDRVDGWVCDVSELWLLEVRLRHFSIA